jgi:uncharacterized protein YecE (DUF72 family)
MILKLKTTGHCFARSLYMNNKRCGQFRAGTSGLVLAEPNKKSYPPEFQDKSRLTYYASKLNSIEINSSFYKIPRGQTFKSWSAMVPDNFQFTVKLWRGITHEKEWSYRQEDLELFFAAIDFLGNKKGCLLVQFPATASFQIEQLDILLQRLQALDPEASWRIAVEFRHNRWYNKEIYEILDHYNASLVMHDMPLSVPLAVNKNAAFLYLRFHGENGDYRGSYTENFLSAKAKLVSEWLQAGKNVYAYFNNTIGDAVANLNTLKRMIESYPEQSVLI